MTRDFWQTLLQLGRAIFEDKTISKVRYVESSLMIADCLTKVTKSGKDLIEVVRSGYYSIPGGNKVRDSTQIAVKTWNQLVQAERNADEDETNIILRLDSELKEADK